ncbi:putative F-box domain containing protein [Helianthus annuus]|nr:putative F-box domain containing protein [Helianthus annuus]
MGRNFRLATRGNLLPTNQEKLCSFCCCRNVESQGERHLIGTKILEGTHYVLHPNGSAMFVVNINEPSDESFPWACDGDSDVLDLKEVFSGEGIANGYGFRYPGSKPGSLFVFEDGMLVFTWKESRAALTLQRVTCKIF